MADQAEQTPRQITQDQLAGIQQKLDNEVRARVVNVAKEVLAREFTQAKAQADEIKKDLKSAKQDIKQAPDKLPRVIASSPEKTQKSVEVVRVVQNTIKAIQLNNMPMPTGTSAEVLTRIAQTVHPIFINQNTAPYIHELIDRGINGQLSNPDQLIEAVNQISDLREIDPLLHQRIISDLREKAVGFGASNEQLAKFDSGQPGKPTTEAQIKFELESNNDYRMIENAYTDPPDKEMLQVFYSRTKLEIYVKDQAQKLGVDLDNPGGADYEKKCLELSRKIKNDFTMLIGKLFRSVDESNPGKTWEEGAQAGGVYSNIEMYSRMMVRRITGLQTEPYTADSAMRKINWFVEEDAMTDWEVPVKAMFDKTKEGIQRRRIAQPWTEARRAYGIDDYFLSVRESIESELQTRMFLHNARALFHNPAPEGGYFKALAGYASKYFGAKDIDILWGLNDSEEIATTSGLLHKLDELDYAAYDWVHQPTTTESKADRLKLHERATREYMKRISPTLSKDAWRAQRALIMAIGDLYSLDMGAIENGAWADPPSIAGKKTHTSYGEMSNMPYLAFNLLAHTGLRFDSQALTMGNLLFMPIMGEKGVLGSGTWDHKKLYEYMQRSMDAFVAGKYRDDVNNGIIKMIDLVNFGRVGSLYSRAGWRLEPAYEGLLVKVENKQTVDVVKSWKAVENIGLEILKDYTGKIGSYDANFYKPAGAAMRRELWGYLNTRYFDGKLSDGDFQKLESDPAKLEDNYKKFYWKVLGRGVLQRIPTKFLRSGSERTRFTPEGRKRAWESVREATAGSNNGTAYSQEQFTLAVRDICAAEAKLRRVTSDGMRKELNEKKTLNGFDGSNYNLTVARLKEYLGEIIEGPDKEERIARAVVVLEKTQTFATSKVDSKPDSKTFMDEFTDKWSKGVPVMPFAVATEEIDRTFLAHRGMGSDAERRALGDTAGNEEKVAGALSHLLNGMRQVSLSGKHDYGELIKLIKQAKEQMEGAIGFGPAVEMSHHMAALCINFFKKDTNAKFLMGIGGLGKINSLAGEFAGSSAAVWEWDSKDIDGFLIELRKQNVIPKNPYEIHKAPTYEDVEIKTPFGTIKTKKRKPDFPISEDTMRKEFGADLKSISFDMVNKYLLLAVGAILFYFIKRSFEESFGKKK